MKPLLLALVSALFLAACSGSVSEKATESANGHGAGSITFTHYSGLTEVFAEHRPLVVGKDRRFDAHLSWLADYRAVSSGTLTVELLHADGSIDKGSAGISETPGIFRVLVRAGKTGKPNLRLTLLSDGKTSIHDLGPVEVYATLELAETANPEPPANPSRIAFTKEIQWKIPFLTAEAASERVAETIPVLIDVKFAPDAQAVVAAPIEGILRTNGSIAAAGTSVRRGERLASISPQLGTGEDVATLDLESNEARIQIQAARQDLNRLQTLHAKEAVPLKRVQEAATNLRLAEARLASSSQRRSGVSAGNAGVQILSPLSGMVLSSKLVAGAPVKAGDELMQIGNPEAIWLVARVPEALAARVSNPGGLDVSSTPAPQTLLVGRDLRLVSAGRFVDPVTRTMEVIFTASNGGSFRPGSRLPGRLQTGVTQQALVVPAAAIIEEGGQTVVYVQVEGETFERRIVSRGLASGNRVAVLGDVKPGERVVTVGAAAVRAAAATPDAFGHGHAH